MGLGFSLSALLTIGRGYGAVLNAGKVHGAGERTASHHGVYEALGTQQRATKEKAWGTCC